MSRRPTGGPAAALIGVFLATGAAAQSCKSSGDLRYLGNTIGSAQSVWLSTTIAGDFRLEAASGNTTVDRWSLGDAGAHLSLSPFVSGGSGGTHRLFDAREDCLIDTQNQKGGITLPPLPPGIIRPPVVPPIGVLPPTGITPGLPARPVPPIGTLPPTGITPEIPVRPEPPIGTLPPTGITPERPTRPEPPIGTLPPTGITPERPAVPDPSRPGQTVAPAATATATVGPAALPACVDDSGGKLDPAICDPTVVPPTVPITPGRDLAGLTPWNVWTSLSYSSVTGNAGAGESQIDDTYLAFGADRLVAERTAVGLQVEVEKTSGSAFGGLSEQDTTSFGIGPYFATALSDTWAMSGLLTFGTANKDVRIVTLSGEYDVPRLRANLSFLGQYAWGATYVRPQIIFDYTRFFATDYTLEGTVGGTPVRVAARAPQTDIGTVTPAVEFSRVIETGGSTYVPFVELGATYAWSSEEGGLLVPSGSRETQSDITGRIRAGFRARSSDRFFAEASLGYLSLFEDGVDAVDAGLYLSWNF